MSAKLDRLRHAVATPLHRDVSNDEHRDAILQLGASRAESDPSDEVKIRCLKCHTENDGDAKFCDHCGKSLENDEDAEARDRAKRSAHTMAVQSRMIAKITARSELLEAELASRAQDGLELFSARELSVLGLVPESSAVVQFEGREALGLPSPSEAQAMLRGNR